MDKYIQNFLNELEKTPFLVSSLQVTSEEGHQWSLCKVKPCCEGPFGKHNCAAALPTMSSSCILFFSSKAAPLPALLLLFLQSNYSSSWVTCTLRSCYWKHNASVCMTVTPACPLCCLLPSGHSDSCLWIQFQLCFSIRCLFLPFFLSLFWGFMCCLNTCVL